MNELVSGIITTYERPVEVLERAITSILNQTYKNIELIIVNDSPNFKDNASIRNMIEKYSKTHNINYIVHEKNQGACAARNTGIASSRGSIIGFLDDDDEWVENKVELLIHEFSEDVGIVYSNFLREENGEVKLVINENIEKDPTKLLIGNYIGSTSFPLLLKKAIVDVGMFDTEQLSMQDLDLWIRISKKYKIKFSELPLTIYHVSEDCITQNIQKKVQGYNMIIEKNKDFYKENKLYYSLRLLYAAEGFLVLRNYRYAIKYGSRSIVAFPYSFENIKYLKPIVGKRFKKIFNKIKNIYQ